LQLAQLDAQAGTGDRAALLPEVSALRQKAEGAGETRLACEAISLEIWLLIDMRNDDEAWLAAEAMERCGQALQWPEQKASAQMVFAQLSRYRLADGVTTLQPERHLVQAVADLQGRPARFIRSLIEWEACVLLRQQNKLEPALQRLRGARALSQDLGDFAGVAAADTELAAVLLELNRPAEMLAPLEDAQRVYAASNDGDAAFRMPRVVELKIRALTKLGSPELPAALMQSRQWIDGKSADSYRAALETAIAEGLAAIGRHSAAYEMLGQSVQTTQQMRGRARDSQMQRLQTRYNMARRDAENAELKLSSEASRLQLQAEQDRRHALTAGLVALSVLSLVGFTFGWRELARRRRMGALAMRDELTGQPNRRAVQTYAQEQLTQAQRLGLPFSLAVIDLDHFKQVNDRFGHGVGDAVLRAFAQSASEVLRGQDRMGRWGGEEWLLVMPGTRLDEIDGVYERLRERFAALPMPGLPAGARCTFSMGAAELEAGVTTVEALVATADAALYRAKDEGRNRLAAGSQTGATIKG
jgi:diguanylate cyclase (GGDEF)-like protein